MMTQAFRDRIAAICAPLPGAEKSDPWGGGHDAWKVGEKMFATIGATIPGVAVKTPDIETSAMLIEAGVGSKAPYFHRSWVLLPTDVADDELWHRIVTSYDLVRSKLPAKIRKSLPERNAG